MNLEIPSHAGSEPYRWEWVSRFAIDGGWMVGAELGVKRGHFSVYLVNKVPGLRMIAVDTWSSDGISPTYERYHHENNYARCVERFAGRAIKILRATTHEASKQIPNKSLDFVFIDASHEYEYVLQDITDWEPKTKHMMIGHDWARDSVKKAVREKYEKIIEGPDQCWAVKL